MKSLIIQIPHTIGKPNTVCHGVRYWAMYAYCVDVRYYAGYSSDRPKPRTIQEKLTPNS